MGRLSGKRAIITGAGSGIGRASALLAVSEGASVIAVDLVEDSIDQTAKIIRDNGGEVTTVAADAGDEDAVRNLIDLAVSKFGGLDIFYANAGISGGLVPLSEQTPAHWMEVLRVNLLGPFL
ncbi:MAG: SDR family NAD(P)-dependent oxidoreductase, partial [Parvibaculaceae bacterium]|nr:SDR family NAD(P)-dependent oxidoreductase [Parvibaculaceae bacterium]